MRPGADDCIVQTMKTNLALCVLAVSLAACCASAPAGQGPAVGSVPAELREAEKLDPFYKKHVAVAGFPILGSERVSEAASVWGSVASRTVSVSVSTFSFNHQVSKFANCRFSSPRHLPDQLLFR